MPNERCNCGNAATGSCNDCERATCEGCSTSDFRCVTCHGANAQAVSLFDDPEKVSLDDDEDEREADDFGPEDWDEAFGDFEGSGY